MEIDTDAAHTPVSHLAEFVHNTRLDRMFRRRVQSNSFHLCSDIRCGHAWAHIPDYFTNHSQHYSLGWVTDKIVSKKTKHFIRWLWHQNTKNIRPQPLQSHHSYIITFTLDAPCPHQWAEENRWQITVSSVDCKGSMKHRAQCSFTDYYGLANGWGYLRLICSILEPFINCHCKTKLLLFLTPSLFSHLQANCIAGQSLHIFY